MSHSRIASKINETTKPEDLALIVENSIEVPSFVVSLQKELQEEGETTDVIKEYKKHMADIWLNKYTGDSPGIIKESLDKDNFIEVAYCTEANKLDTATGAEHQKILVECGSFDNFKIMKKSEDAEQKFSEKLGNAALCNASSMLLQEKWQNADPILIDKTVAAAAFVTLKNQMPSLTPEKIIGEIDN